MVELKCTCYIDEAGNYKVEEDVYTTIYGIMDKLKQEGNVFAGKRDRLNLAPSSFLIKYNGVDAGFIYIAKEGRYKPGLFIDMAIIKEYRGLGIGKNVIEQLIDSLEISDREFLIGEVKKDNEASNKLSGDIGIKILEGNYNYYLFPKSRYEEFLEFNKDCKFERAMQKANMTSNEMIHQIYEDEYNKPKQLIKK